MIGKSILNYEIKSIIGEGVNIQGELQFDRLLRIDGTFEGMLVFILILYKFIV